MVKQNQTKSNKIKQNQTNQTRMEMLSKKERKTLIRQTTKHTRNWADKTDSLVANQVPIENHPTRRRRKGQKERERERKRRAQEQ